MTRASRVGNGEMKCKSLVQVQRCTDVAILDEQMVEEEEQRKAREQPLLHAEALRSSAAEAEPSFQPSPTSNSS